MEGRQRDLLPDVLKGFGIILMVLGHCIQSGSGLAYLENACYFEDKLYQFIYSFHMPLFMVISGYYAWGSLQRAQSARERRRMVARRCVCLIVPNIVWKILEFAYLLAADIYIYRGTGTLLRDVGIGILTNFWFLWAVLYAFLLVCLMHYLLRDSAWVYILIFVAMFFTPDGLGLNAYKYMLPYYLIGFYVNKNRHRLSGLPGGRVGTAWGILGGGLVFFAAFYFFDADSFIYLTGYKLIGKDYGVQLGIDVYRFFVGLCGIVFWILVWKALLGLRRTPGRAAEALAYFGRRGFGIYIISSILVPHAVHPLTADWQPNYGLNVVETVAVLLVSAVVVEALRRVKYVCALVGEDWSAVKRDDV